MTTQVLLVEDDTDLREALTEALESSDHHVLPASDGEQALQMMRLLRPDIVVLDLMMPVMDGWQFRLAQRQDPALAATPVVAISASQSPAAAAVGADLYLQKPFTAKALALAIDSVLQSRERRLEPARVAQTERMAALGTLAAGLAHEINNPLTYVLLHLASAVRIVPELDCTDHAKRDQLHHALKDALEGAERIRGITSGIRAFSRSDDQVIKTLDLRGPLEAAIKLTSNEVRHRARLERTDAPMPLVRGNDSRLGQVFLNLLTNATHAIDPGDAERNCIRVTTGSADGGAIVEISDTGHGVPDYLLARIFEPFFTTKPIGQGTGLGLSISHGIIESLGGKITVTSEVGVGTTFRVWLPPARS
jgi:signal transduction histidine kinase